MKRNSSVANNSRHVRRKLTYVKSVSEIPDFKSDDEIASWYETHSTLFIQDQLESLPAKIGGKLRSRLTSRRGQQSRFRTSRPHTSSVS